MTDATGRPIGRPAYGQLEGEAEVIETMAALARSGLGGRRIAKVLNESGLTARHGGKWHPASVDAILRRLAQEGRIPAPGRRPENGGRSSQPPAIAVLYRIAARLPLLKPLERRALIGDLLLFRLRPWLEAHPRPTPEQFNAIAAELGRDVIVLGNVALAAEPQPLLPLIPGADEEVPLEDPAANVAIATFMALAAALEDAETEKDDQAAP